jgi:hypothetical protein
MVQKIGRLFVIKTRFEACAVIYALAVGAMTRGMQYREIYPGFVGYLFVAAAVGVVFMAGAKLMEATRPDAGHRRRKDDLDQFGTPVRATR